MALCYYQAMGRGSSVEFDIYSVGSRTRSASLLSHTKRLGLEAENLDEAVHDSVDGIASSAYNSGAGEDIDEVHDTASHYASEINNGGLPAQVAYLVEAYGEAGARSTIDAIAA